MKTSERKSKQQILKSTGILGSVQVITIAIGILKTKALAILLGPLGLGIAGIYQLTITLIGAATNLGLSFSGVREIASAAASDDRKHIARTVLVLKRWAWVSGVAGMALSIIFCEPLSRIAFNDEKYASGIVLLSITLLSSALAGGMNALLQGMRRINDVALSNIISAIVSLLFSGIVYYVWGLRGVVPALVVSFLSAQIIAWYFVRKIHIPKVQLSFRETFVGGRTMVKLGIFMTATILLNYGFMYVVRYFIIKQAGLESVGFFIAAWTVSSIYISAIFSAMSTDFYPRLSAVHHDNNEVNRLANEQTEVALLLAGPVIVMMISFIKLVVQIFYSKSFEVTGEILNWQLTGDFIKVLGYPLGFVLLAKAKGKLVIATELLWNLTYLVLIFFGWKYFGLKITGIAFLVAYIVNVLSVLLLLRKITTYRWSKNIKRSLLFFAPLLILALANSVTDLTPWLRYSFGFVLSASALVFSFRQLRKIINFNTLFQKIGVRVSFKQHLKGKLAPAEQTQVLP
jgi:O-antigen/teichoic acid export membrane protein